MSRENRRRWPCAVLNAHRATLRQIFVIPSDLLGLQGLREWRRTIYLIEKYIETPAEPDAGARLDDHRPAAAGGALRLAAGACDGVAGLVLTYCIHWAYHLAEAAPSIGLDVLPEHNMERGLPRRLVEFRLIHAPRLAQTAVKEA
jgi:hypothetical protein